MVGEQKAEVEKMVGQLMAGVQTFGEFSPPDGMSAVFTFSYRFARTILTLSPNSEARAHNKEVIVGALKRMAALIEFEEQKDAQEKVH